MTSPVATSALHDRPGGDDRRIAPVPRPGTQQTSAPRCLLDQTGSTPSATATWTVRVGPKARSQGAGSISILGHDRPQSHKRCLEGL